MGRKKKEKTELNLDDPAAKLGRAKMGRWQRISAKQRPFLIEAIVPMLAESRPNQEIADTLRVTPQIVTKYSRDPEVIAKVEEYRINYWQEVKSSLRMLGKVAVNTLQNLMENARSEHVRFEAANAVIVHLRELFPDAHMGGEEAQKEMLDELRKLVASKPPPQISIGTINVTAEKMQQLLKDSQQVVDGEIRELKEGSKPGEEGSDDSGQEGEGE